MNLIIKLANNSYNLNNQKSEYNIEQLNLERQKLIEEIKIIPSKKLDKMPQICFGTVRDKLEIALPLVFELGYRHIDGAEGYGGDDYKKIIRDAIKKIQTNIQREELWITWKSDYITVDNIKQIVNKLECGYIDLFLIHHNCGIDNDFIEFKKAQSEGLIKHYGVSNCLSEKVIKVLKETHDIFANQIQAKPPNGRIEGSKEYHSNFIENCNKIGVEIMLYSPLSGASSADNIVEILEKHNYELEPFFKDVNKYYIQKYLINTNNVIMIGSKGNRDNLLKNINEVNNITNSKDLLTPERLKEIEQFLESLILKDQG